MGNQLRSLRAPPPPSGEDERNHPLYYNWNVPRWTPFRCDKKGGPLEAPNSSSNVAAPKADKETQQVTTSGVPVKQTSQVEPPRTATRVTNSNQGAMKQTLKTGKVAKKSAAIDESRTKMGGTKSSSGKQAGN